MRILQVFDFISPCRGGGTLSLLKPLSKSLSQKHDVSIYTTDYEVTYASLCEFGNIKVFPFPVKFSFGGFCITPKIIDEAKNNLWKFDVIHLHCFRSFQNVVVHHYAKKHGIPYILDTHGSLPRSFNGKWSVKVVLKWFFDVVFGYRILRDASKVVAENQFGVKEYKQFGVEESKIAVITPPFPVEQFAELSQRDLFRESYGITGQRIVMFLGRINWIKGIDFLAKAFAELAKQRDDIILVIVGADDGYEETLRKLISELGLDHKVLFTGYLSGKEKLSALVDADVVVQTSKYEQGAYAPLEAVLCNTPIIVSNNSGAGEDVKRMSAGYLVGYGNKEELCSMIEYVFAHPEEASLKTKRAKEYIIKNLSMAKGISEYEQLYKGVLN